MRPVSARRRSSTGCVTCVRGPAFALLRVGALARHLIGDHMTERTQDDRQLSVAVAVLAARRAGIPVDVGKLLDEAGVTSAVGVISGLIFAAVEALDQLGDEGDLLLAELGLRAALDPSPLPPEGRTDG